MISPNQLIGSIRNVRSGKENPHKSNQIKSNSKFKLISIRTEHVQSVLIMFADKNKRAGQY